MYCTNCGQEINDGSEFCAYCGADLKGTSEQDQADQQPVESQQYQQPVTDQQTAASQQYQQYQQPQGQQYQNGYGQYQYQQPQGQQYQNGYGQYQQGTQSYNSNEWKPNNGSVSFIDAIKLMFLNYVNFTGRASISELWWGLLCSFIACLVLSFIPYVGYILSIGILIPTIALEIRRFHDIGKDWYWIFLGLIPIAGTIIFIYYFCQPSVGDNQWGPANPNDVNNYNNYNNNNFQ